MSTHSYTAQATWHHHATLKRRQNRVDTSFGAKVKIMGKKKVSVFSKSERASILSRPLKDVIRGKQLQQQKWCMVWLKAKQTYEDEFGRPDGGDAKVINQLYMKQDKYTAQLHVLERCPPKEDGQVLTNEELLQAEHPPYH